MRPAFPPGLFQFGYEELLFEDRFLFVMLKKKKTSFK